MPPAYLVVPPEINLRRQPRVAPGTVMTTLPQGHPVEKVEAAAGAPGWWLVAVRLPGSGRRVRGYLRASLLRAAPRPAPAAPPAPPSEPALFMPPAMHLPPPGPVRRAEAGNWQHPLREAGQPQPPGTGAARGPARLTSIVAWLDVERSARYRPRPAATYCNIYAHDYCYLAGAYLPRVWWTRPALTALAAGQAVVPRYGATVRELNANALYDWLLDYGSAFGWERLTEVAELQAAANAGRAALVVAQRRDLNQPGHIVVVVPETTQHQAPRRASGAVAAPLQSQAGRRNAAYLAARTAWWAGAQFRRFAFWAQA